MNNIREQEIKDVQRRVVKLDDLQRELKTTVDQATDMSIRVEEEVLDLQKSFKSLLTDTSKLDE